MGNVDVSSSIFVLASGKLTYDLPMINMETIQ